MRIERRTFDKLALAGAATGFAGSARAQAKLLTIGFGEALTGLRPALHHVGTMLPEGAISRSQRADVFIVIIVTIVIDNA
jgi:hypothetical protein